VYSITFMRHILLMSVDCMQNFVVLQPATRIPPQPSHTETPTHIETRTHGQCGDTIEKLQAPDDPDLLMSETC